MSKEYDKQINNEAHQTRKGEALANLLNLKRIKGKYLTKWGSKTALGLYLTVWRFMESDSTEI